MELLGVLIILLIIALFSSGEEDEARIIKPIQNAALESSAFAAVMVEPSRPEPIARIYAASPEEILRCGIEKAKRMRRQKGKRSRG